MRGRFARLTHFLALGGIVLGIAGCGAPLTSQTLVVASPGVTSIVTATPHPSGSPASQAITIATDRTVYATTAAIQVTVMNHANISVMATPGHASCTILTLEMLTNGQWQTSDAAPCPMQPASAWAQLRPNILYHEVIRGLALPYHPRPFAAGEYRLVIAYWQTITGAIPGPNDSNSIISPSFAIQ